MLFLEEALEEVDMRAEVGRDMGGPAPSKSQEGTSGSGAFFRSDNLGPMSSLPSKSS